MRASPCNVCFSKRTVSLSHLAGIDKYSLQRRSMRDRGPSAGARLEISGHEPNVIRGRAAAKAVDQCVEHLRAVAGKSGSYENETNYFERDWQRTSWGDNYSRLAEIERMYDPPGLFFVHNGAERCGHPRSADSRRLAQVNARTGLTPRLSSQHYQRPPP